MDDQDPNPDIKNKKENNHLPTEREFKQLLEHDEDVPLGAALANYSVYHRYNRGC